MTLLDAASEPVREGEELAAAVTLREDVNVEEREALTLGLRVPLRVVVVDREGVREVLGVGDTESVDERETDACELALPVGDAEYDAESEAVEDGARDADAVCDRDGLKLGVARARG